MYCFLGWSRKKIASGLLVTSMLFVGACSAGDSNTAGAEGSSQNHSGKVIRISIGTQDQVINTAVGGAAVRELELLEKYLPTDGKYEGVQYDIEWSSYTSGPPITNRMLANQIDIGLMGDFPAVINMVTFQQEARDANSIFVGTLAYSATGAGNAVVVPMDSDATSLADLKGGTVSVPFGSAAHGMLLNALADVGLDPETDIELISQSPEVGGASLRTRQIDAHADFVPFGELFPFRGFARKIFDGAQTGVPTLHGIVVRSDFAEEYPEIVVAYLKAVLEANQLFRADPEGLSAQIEEWSGINKEVVYMFLGPSGLQPLDPTIRETQVEALKNSIATLTKLGRIEDPIDPSEVVNWIDESYLRQAMEAMDLDYDDVIATAEAYQITGEDALTGEAITDPKQAAQFWVQGEETVRNFASVANMVKALMELQAEGEAADVMFVHDHNHGWKLFAENSYFVSSGDEVAAFLLEADAQAYASETGGQMTAFRRLQDLYATDQPILVGATPVAN
jgi:NitT/TauT family transport system substrate-binding protein